MLFLNYFIVVFGCNCSNESKINYADKTVPNKSENEYSSLIFNNTKNQLLSYENIFDEIIDLNQGRNEVKSPSIISTEGWQSKDILIREAYKNISISISDSLNQIRTKTEDKKWEKELNFSVEFDKQFSQKRASFLESFFLDTTFLKKYNLREEKIENYYEEKRQFLEDYCVRHNLDSTFLTDWQEIIMYDKLFRKTYFGNYNKWDAKYLKELSYNLKYYNNDELLYIPYYRKGCWGISNLLYYLENPGEDLSLKQYYTLISSNFKSHTKVYMQFKILSWVKNNRTDFKFTHAEYDSLVNEFILTSKSLQYNVYLKDLLGNNRKVEISNDELLSLNQAPKTLKAICDSKITYIDFWASWCLPCRKEMPISQKLNNKYKNRGVNFVYISIDENFKAWAKATNQMGLSEDESYFLPKGSESEIAQKFNITTIPRYILIGKDGEVINANAPRPSDAETKILFEQLLKKK